VDFNDTPEQAEYRAEVRAWLRANARPLVGRPTVSRRLDAQEGLALAKEWQAKKADAGYACRHFPEAYGGKGRPILETVIYEQEEEHFDVPSGFFEIGLGMCAPVLMQYATEEQKRRYVPPMVRGEEVWCQLFSEPGAGSDLAGLRMRAEQDGADWVDDRSLYLRRRPHPARQGPQGRQAARDHPDPARHARCCRPCATATASTPPMSTMWCWAASPGGRTGQRHRPRRGAERRLCRNHAGVQINRFCASGLEATNMAAAKVMTGEADVRHRRRRRIDEPRADGLRRRRLGDGPGEWPSRPISRRRASAPT
jgi:hypothetical protein